jgi:hypothetical protein
MTRKFFTILALLLLGSTSAHAANVKFCRSMIRYDVDSGTVTSCNVTGLNQDPCGGYITGVAWIKSAADPSATIQSNTALSGSLTGIAVTDILFIAKPTIASPTLEPFAAGLAAVVTAVTDVNQVTVDPTVSWSTGYGYTFGKTTCGTTDAHGWVDASGASSVTLSIQYEQGDLDALSWQFQCRHPVASSLPVIVYPSESSDCGSSGTLASGFCDFATAGATTGLSYTTYGNWAACRIAFKRKTTDTSDAGANLERVTGSITVRREN